MPYSNSLGPTVCPHRHALGGRNFESFSEDPLLAGLLASQFINGLQGEGIAATIKHFAANEQETCRFEIDEEISQRALRYYSNTILLTMMVLMLLLEKYTLNLSKLL